MGDPKFTKKKFTTPPHPWQKTRIDEEKQLIREYGLRNKKEVWMMKSKAKNFADQAKRLTAKETDQSTKEKEQLLTKLYRFNLLPKGAGVDDVLGLTIRDILERRLQTVVFKKGLAKSMKQARQFITHRHIAVDNKIITAPSYILSAAEEGAVTFLQKSALSDAEHPERVIKKEVPGERVDKEKAAKAAKKKTAKRKDVKAEKKQVKKTETPKKKEEPKDKAEEKSAEEKAPSEEKKGEEK